jgi:hypothetical protein
MLQSSADDSAWSPNADWEKAFNLPSDISRGVSEASEVRALILPRTPYEKLGPQLHSPAFLFSSLSKAAVTALHGGRPAIIFELPHADIVSISCALVGGVASSAAQRQYLPVSLSLAWAPGPSLWRITLWIPGQSSIERDCVVSPSSVSSALGLAGALAGAAGALRGLDPHLLVVRTFAIFNGYNGCARPESASSVRLLDISSPTSAMFFAKALHASNQASLSPPIIPPGGTSVLQALSNLCCALSETPAGLRLQGGIALNHTLRLLSKDVPLFRAVRFDAAQQRALLIPCGLSNSTIPLPVVDPAFLATALH